MSRLFIGRKELSFVKNVNKELIQKIIGQEVYYYAILADKTETNNLYNESIQKVWSPPVKCNALVSYDNMNEVMGALPPDSKFKMDIFFHKAELQERNLSPKMGDFVQFGEIMFEIYSVSEPQMAFGMIEEKIMIKCNCGPARKGQFDPTKSPMPSPHYDRNAPRYSEQPRDVKLKGERK